VDSVRIGSNQFKRDLQSDRLSCHLYRANAFRLQLHALAYQLLVLFRLHALKKTQLAQVRLQSLRLKLFKVGARFNRSARHLWFHLSSSWPGRDLFVEVWQNLNACLSRHPINSRSLPLHLRPGCVPEDKT
jgi:hypothetical protein